MAWMGECLGRGYGWTDCFFTDGAKSVEDYYEEDFEADHGSGWGLEYE